MPISRLHKYRGPALWSYGFRPFFLFGSLYSGLSVLLWLPQFYGELELSTQFAPVDWHIHEMLFGYLAAVIAGFLFTAIPNWTGRMPIRGLPLATLFVVWACGRLAVTFSVWLGWGVAIAIDLSFLVAIIAVVIREIVAGKNWRNLKIVIPVFGLLAANAAFHLEVHYSGISNFSRRLAMAAVLTLIMIIGGRIIPSFTRNWLVKNNEGRLPAPFNRFDGGAILMGAIALLSWTAYPESTVVGVLLVIASIVHVLRLARWVGHRALRDPMVVILHVSYLFIPVGFALISLSLIQPELVPTMAGTHALGIGVVGTMTLSVMVRATLGHTGRAVEASLPVMLIFACVFLSATSRIAAAFGPESVDTLLHIAAFSWLAAFAGFAIVFAPALMRPRASAKD
jgi:uncharacterized protein involved in response to NO